MNLSNLNNNNNHLMETHNMVGSTTAGGDGGNNNNNNNNNLSSTRSNGNAAQPAYEGNYQVDISSTNFELESITSSYAGLMRIYRLLYIAEHCPTLRHEALLASLRYIQDTHYVSLYKQVKSKDILTFFFS